MTLTDCIKQILTGKETREQSKAHLANAQDGYLNYFSDVLAEIKEKLKDKSDNNPFVKEHEKLDWLSQSRIIADNSHPDENRLAKTISKLNKSASVMYYSSDPYLARGALGKFIHYSYPRQLNENIDKFKSGKAYEKAYCIYGVLKNENENKKVCGSNHIEEYTDELVAEEIVNKRKGSGWRSLLHFNHLTDEEGNRYLAFGTSIDNEVHCKKEKIDNADKFRINNSKIQALVDATIEYHDLAQSVRYRKLQPRIDYMVQTLAKAVVKQGADAASNLLDFGRLEK